VNFLLKLIPQEIGIYCDMLISPLMARWPIDDRLQVGMDKMCILWWRNVGF